MINSVTWGSGDSCLLPMTVPDPASCFMSQYLFVNFSVSFTPLFYVFLYVLFLLYVCEYVIL